MGKMLDVRREYGEPFTDVVRGFAEMGYSRTLTASVLDINLSYFRELLTRFDLHRHFRNQAEMRRDCKGGGKGWPKGRKRNAGYILARGVRYYPGEPSYHYHKEARNERSTTGQKRTVAARGTSPSRRV